MGLNLNLISEQVKYLEIYDNNTTKMYNYGRYTNK